EHVVQPAGSFVIQTHVPCLPCRCEETACRLTEDIGENMLSAFERAPRCFGVQAAHLVAALGDPRGRSPASLTAVEVAVQEKLLAALLDEPAIVPLCRQRPLALPVGNDAAGNTAPEQRRKGADHYPRLTGVSRSDV